MNAEVNPKVAAVIIALLVVIVGVFLYVKTAPPKPSAKGITFTIKNPNASQQSQQ